MKVNITEKVKYIGVDDTTIDLFESQYVVPEGVSYNSYVILDEKVAVMDTVDKRGMEEWEKNLMAELNGRAVDYLVVHHLEPDHAGSIERLVELFPNVTLVGNAKTFAMLPQFFDMNLDGKTLVVKEGDVLSLGEHELTFVMAPMVHWPEVMVTYDKTDKILFSADGFGKFGALELTKDAGWACEARRYYFNIVGKYGAPVQTLLKKAANLDINIICPLHGPVLSENLSYYIDLYDTWSSYKAEAKGVLVAYASIHGNTAAVAEKIGEMLREKGVEKVVVSDLARDDMAEVIEDAFKYDRMIVAAASYDGGVFPWMQDFLSHLQSKAYQNRKVAIVENGSWAPSAAKVMKPMIEAMKNIDLVEDIVTIRSTMKDSDMAAIEKLVDSMV
ncbi:MAG: FprA family A-type flavoprotein [Lachnospiraceae bacterium]|nr:FprA family A-type flavoprotein [Lachnospiraceae bacterium]